MKSNSPKYWFFVIGFLIVVFIFIRGTSCIPFQMQRISKEIFPVVYVWPRGHVNIACYNLARSSSMPTLRGVGATLSGTGLLYIEFPPPDQVSDWKSYVEMEEQFPLEERVNLYVDGAQLSNAGKIIENDSVPLSLTLSQPSGLSSAYYASWIPSLSFGKHTVKIVIETLSGKTFEYEWNFTITWW
jgi:hypothetical protein